MNAFKNEKVLKEFGKTVKRLRLEKGLSTRQFAYAADIAHSAVGRLEAGLSNPTLTTFLKIAAALEVSPTRLLAFD